MKVFIAIVLIIFAVIVIIIVTPIINRQSPQAAATGGTLYKSEDDGENWQGISKFQGGDISKILIDAEDKDFLIIGTSKRGLWRVRRDGGEITRYLEALGDGAKISNILNPAYSRNLRALTFYQKRGHVISYVGGKQKELLFAPLDNFGFISGFEFGGGRVIKIAGSDGSLFQSTDKGEAWEVIARFGEGIAFMEVNPENFNEIWVVNGKGSLYHSEDGGRDWEDFTRSLNNFSNSKKTRAIAYDAKSGTFYHASNYGLLKSFDKGKNFEQVKMTVPPSSLPITAIAASLTSNEKIYAASLNQLFISDDAGQTWRSRRLNVKGVISQILLDPSNSRRIFIGLSGS